MWLSWLRYQPHKQYDTGSSSVKNIKIGFKILCRSDLIQLCINKLSALVKTMDALIRERL